MNWSLRLSRHVQPRTGENFAHTSESAFDTYIPRGTYSRMLWFRVLPEVYDSSNGLDTELGNRPGFSLLEDAY